MLLLLLLIGLLLLLFIFWPQSKAGKANTENPVNIENIEKQYVPVIENVNNDVPKNPEALDKFSIKDINKPITLLPVDDVFIVYKDELIILDVLKNDKGDGLKIIGVTKSQFGERSILTDQ